MIEQIENDISPAWRCKGYLYDENLQYFNPYSSGIDCRRQNITSKVDPHTVKLNIFLMVVDP